MQKYALGILQGVGSRSAWDRLIAGVWLIVITWYEIRSTCSGFGLVMVVRLAAFVHVAQPSDEYPRARNGVLQTMLLHGYAAAGLDGSCSRLSTSDQTFQDDHLGVYDWYNSDSVHPFGSLVVELALLSRSQRLE
jgi:hypothetical protein